MIIPNKIRPRGVSVYASHAIGRRLASQPGHTRDHDKNGTKCLPAWHACVRLGV